MRLLVAAGSLSAGAQESKADVLTGAGVPHALSETSRAACKNLPPNQAVQVPMPAVRRCGEFNLLFKISGSLLVEVKQREAVKVFFCRKGNY